MGRDLSRFHLPCGGFLPCNIGWRGVRGAVRLGAPGDAGMVPLEEAQIPGSRRSQAETHRCGMVGRKEWGCDSGDGSLSLVHAMSEKKAQKTLVQTNMIIMGRRIKIADLLNSYE